MEANKVTLYRNHDNEYNQLTLLFEVFDKVSFATEPTIQFARIVASLFSAQKVVLLLLKIVHSMIIIRNRIYW